MGEWVELEKKRECIQIMLRELPTRPAEICFIGTEFKARPLQKGLASHAPVHTSLLDLQVGQAHSKATEGCNTIHQLPYSLTAAPPGLSGFCLHRQEYKVSGGSDLVCSLTSCFR